MKFLNPDLIKELESVISQLDKPVIIHYFTQEHECRFCSDTRILLQEIASISLKISLEVHDFVTERDLAAKMLIDKIPATAVVSEDGDPGIRFFGIPSGYEFSSFIDAIRLVSSGMSSLSQETKNFLDKLSRDIHLQVFVTPTCPYCPGAVTLAHQLAYYSPRIRADMVEATEFPHLAQRYRVMGVPKTVINEELFHEGAAPENILIEKIKSGLT